ncbi:hypothetical protein CALVIDRAFT_538061 [Calocera viscosa TUFC12733]|uniref:Uncharacterized protein n=1 Tax=Calocera viscosa (strain TUFC12733) TaxID=1330018 RepID=A0A167LGC9_CALVF|nr:hypothetical protein CALVIDRAFT_538061 [Calocera viscosa TUFC12733]
MASRAGSRGNPILLDTSPHHRTISAEHPHNRTVDDLIEEERERQSLFFHAPQHEVSSTSAAGPSQPGTSHISMQPPADHGSKKTRPGAGRPRANTAAASLGRHKLPTVAEEADGTSSEEPLAHHPAPPPVRPIFPQSASDPTVAALTRSRAHTAPGSHLGPDSGIFRHETGRNGGGSHTLEDLIPRRGDGVIASRLLTRRNSKGKSASTSNLKTCVIDKGKGKLTDKGKGKADESADEPPKSKGRGKAVDSSLERRNSNKGKGKAVDSALERRSSKGKGKAKEPEPEADGKRSGKKKEIVTAPRVANIRWPGFDAEYFYQEHNPDEVEAMKVTGLKRLSPPSVPTIYLTGGTPDMEKNTQHTEAEEFILSADQELDFHGVAHARTESPVDTTMSCGESGPPGPMGPNEWETWQHLQRTTASGWHENALSGAPGPSVPRVSQGSSQHYQQSAPPMLDTDLQAYALPMASQTPLSASAPQWNALPGQPYMDPQTVTPLSASAPQWNAPQNPQSYIDPQTEIQAGMPENLWDDVLSFMDPSIFQSPQPPGEEAQFSAGTMMATDWGLMQQGGVSAPTMPYIPPSTDGSAIPQQYQERQTMPRLPHFSEMIAGSERITPQQPQQAMQYTAPDASIQSMPYTAPGPSIPPQPHAQYAPYPTQPQATYHPNTFRTNEHYGLIHHQEPQAQDLSALGYPYEHGPPRTA